MDGSIIIRCSRIRGKGSLGKFHFVPFQAIKSRRAEIKMIVKRDLQANTGMESKLILCLLLYIVDQVSYRCGLRTGKNANAVLRPAEKNGHNKCDSNYNMFHTHMEKGGKLKDRELIAHGKNKVIILKGCAGAN